MLQRVANCLSSSVREADTVSRHGSDEFLILLTDMAQSTDASLVADKMLATLAVPTRVGDHVLRLSASIGISIYPEDGEDAATLIDRANSAMCRAKTNGRGSFDFYGGEPAGERNLKTAALAALQRPLTRYDAAMSEHERRHSEMREANEQLVVAALSAQQLVTAAEVARQEQIQLLAVVAHELRNPLTPIRTAAALMGRVKSEELPRVQAIIERQVAHMARLVGDLLDVSRVNTGKLRIEPRLVEMANVIDEAIDSCRPAMDMRLQHFRVDVPSCALEVHGDPVRLTQILSNLLDNASKYTPNEGEIKLSVEVVGETIVTTVSDNGIGITDEALPKVFDPFVQDSRAIGFNGLGLGIGLTVVRELVEAHGGTVVAASAGTGLGSQFVVALPLVRRSSELVPGTTSLS